MLTLCPSPLHTLTHQVLLDSFMSGEEGGGGGGGGGDGSLTGEHCGKGGSTSANSRTRRSYFVHGDSSRRLGTLFADSQTSLAGLARALSIPALLPLPFISRTIVAPSLPLIRFGLSLSREGALGTSWMGGWERVMGDEVCSRAVSE